MADMGPFSEKIAINVDIEIVWHNAMPITFFPATCSGFI
jgi:diacylglycerol kinase family enzyme